MISFLIGLMGGATAGFFVGAAHGFEKGREALEKLRADLHL